MKNIAIILAGGVGRRFGSNIPKQFIRIAGKPILQHTLEKFQDNELIDEILLVINKDSRDEAQEIADNAKIKKLSKIIVGGKERSDSTQAALNAITDDEANLLIHDSVRPFVSDEIIKECLDALEEYDAVDTALASVDTIVKVTDENTIDDIPNRKYIYRGQTPQAFKLSVIKKGYELATKAAKESNTPLQVTDDCGVIHKYCKDTPIKIVEGAEENIKITKNFDVQIADKIFQFNAKESTNFDSIYEEFSGLLKGAGVEDGMEIDSELKNDAGVGKYINEHAELANLKESFKGKVFLFFGGSSGIGKTIKNFAELLGADVASFSINDETSTDVTDVESVERAFKTTYEKYGRIDNVIVSAGILMIKELKDMHADEMNKLISVNLLGPAIVSNVAHKYLKESKGQIMFFTSSSYTRGRANYSLYSASKAGVVNFTQALCDEWLKDDIKVNTINPQRTATPMRFAAFGKEPDGTLLTPEKVAAYALGVLNSDFTGQIINVTVK